MRISDWSSDVCSSDLVAGDAPSHRFPLLAERAFGAPIDIGEARATLDTRIAALHRRAHALMDRLDIAPGAIAARFDAAFDDPRWRYADSDELGRASCRERGCQYV